MFIKLGLCGQQIKILHYNGLYVVWYLLGASRGTPSQIFAFLALISLPYFFDNTCTVELQGLEN